jgi:cell division protein FtsB
MRSYSQRQQEKVSKLQAELQKAKEECDALELYIWKLEGEKEALRCILRAEKK